MNDKQLSRILTLLKIAGSRLKMLQTKHESMKMRSYTEIANLLEKGKHETARIKTEALIRLDLYIEALERTEMYCMQLQTRISLLKNKSLDPSVRESVYSLVFASLKLDIKELCSFTACIYDRFGKDLFLDIDESELVCSKLKQKLAIAPVSDELINSYCTEIGNAYKVNYNEPAAALDDDFMLRVARLKK